ncbi:hypothetical protein Syun_000941 [Stephania yunnanensis]|uniref:Uncharacterized protein n=1 Tax=Stephania yunnanensis TaxID=152371 RepID=A0AAP0LD08_9MAGN
MKTSRMKKTVKKRSRGFHGQLYPDAMNSHPNQRHYQTDTFADYDDLRIIVGNATASGRYSIGLGDDTDARTFEVEEPSGDVLEDLTYDYDAEALYKETSINEKSISTSNSWKL